MQVDSRARHLQFEQLLIDAFRKAGWSVARQPTLGVKRPDLLVRRGPLAYAIELESAPEGRRDRLIPLLARAILQAQAAVQNSSAIAPLAVIASGRIPESLANDVRKFVSEYAPGVAAGVIDLEGFRSFAGDGLDELNASRQRGSGSHSRQSAPQHHLFSNLNQWMLKVLLAPQVRDDLLAAPRGEYRNASELARAAAVSVMSANRFARQLRADGFLDKSAPILRLVRLVDLMNRWRAACLRPPREWPMRWILRGEPVNKLAQLFRVVESEQQSVSGRLHPSPRICLGLFAAAEVLGISVVHGVPSHLHVVHFGSDLARRLGLMRAEPGEPPDVYVRIPSAPQAVFRAAVRRGDLLVSDILQVWLDVADHPARGRAQALEIERRALRPLFAGSR